MQTRAAERDSTKRLDVLASYITLSSIVYYAVVIALLHILRSDFNPGYRYLSEYARGPYGALMTSTFFVLSAGSLALLLGLCRSVTSRVHFVPGLVLWFAWACAVFLAGIYTSDLQGTPHTRIGRIHDQMGMIAFPSATVALLLLSFGSALGEGVAFGLASRNAPICGSFRLLLGSRSVWRKGLRGSGPAYLSRRDTDLDVDYRQKNTGDCESGRSSDELIKEMAFA